MVGVERIVSWSGGKDSTATIILAKEHGIPIDYILFSEVMFDNKTSCELPEHMSFVKEVAIPRFEEWGYKTEILHHNKTYMDYFNQVRKSGKNIGKRVGFPMADRCNARNCKVAPINKFLREHKSCVQYVGICADEPLRLASLHKDASKVSLLEKYGYSGQQAREKCKEYGLLSPYYQYSKRGGCWCCPNASDEQLSYIRAHHPELWNKLLSLEKEENLVGNIFNTKTGTSIYDIEERLFWKERQLSLLDLCRRIE